MFKVKWKNEAPSIHIDYLDEPTYYLAAGEESDGHPWFHDIKRYLEKQEYSEYASIMDKKYLRNLSAKFFLSGDVLYKRNYDLVLLRCVDRHKGDQIKMEIHEGSFGAHASGHTMVKNILRVGYY